MAGFTPQTVGEAQGLRAAPRDYTNQIIGAQRLKRQEEAAKKKQEEDEFAKLADIKVDYSKYHRLDRDRVKQMMAGYIGEMRKAYQSGNPNWRNIAYEKGSELKFDIQQAIVDSQQKFAFEKYYEDPNSLKTKQADAVYQWYKQGDFTTPPQIQVDEYGQINSVDPATGTYGFVPAKRYNLSTLANKSVFDPAIDGYETTTEGSTKLPTGEVVYKQRAIYNPEMIAGAISSLAGSQEFLGWKIDNGDRIRKEVAANADRPPEEVMYELWAEDIMKYGGDKFKETIQQENKGMTINNYPAVNQETDMAGYGTKPIYVHGFVAEEGKPLQYSETYTVDGEPKNFSTSTIDGFTLGGQTVKIAGGPYIKDMKDPTKTLSGALDIELGDMAVVPVYKSGTTQTRGGKEVNIGNVVIPDQALDSAKESNSVEYRVIVFGNKGGGNKTYYGDAEAIISNATFLKEDKVDKKTLYRNLEILKEKAKKQNELLGVTQKAPAEKKKTTPSGEKMSYPEWKKSNPNGTITEFNKYKAE